MQNSNRHDIIQTLNQQLSNVLAEYAKLKNMLGEFETCFNEYCRKFCPLGEGSGKIPCDIHCENFQILTRMQNILDRYFKLLAKISRTY